MKCNSELQFCEVQCYFRVPPSVQKINGININVVTCQILKES